MNGESSEGPHHLQNQWLNPENHATIVKSVTSLISIRFKSALSLQDCQDSVSEAYRRLLQMEATRQPGSDPIHNPGGWLYTAAGRIALDLIKSRRLIDDVPPVAPVARHEDHVARLIRREKAMRGLEALGSVPPPPQSIVFVMLNFERRKQKEVVSDFGDVPLEKLARDLAARTVNSEIPREAWVRYFKGLTERMESPVSSLASRTIAHVPNENRSFRIADTCLLDYLNRSALTDSPFSTWLQAVMTALSNSGFYGGEE